MGFALVRVPLDGFEVHSGVSVQSPQPAEQYVLPRPAVVRCSYLHVHLRGTSAVGTL